MRKKVVIIAFLMLAILTIAGVAYYPGCKAVYLLFSLFCHGILVMSLRKPSSYGFTVISILLWLGFWLKITIHLLLGTEYAEPIGNFDFSGSQFDKVLEVAGVGILGVAIAGFISNISLRKYNPISRTRDIPENGNKMSRFFDFLYIALAVIIVVFAFLDKRFNIQQTGIVPSVVLPFKFGVFFSWMLTTGLAFLVVALIIWDSRSEELWVRYFALALLEAVAMSMALLSRSVFLFHMIPIFVSCLVTDRFHFGTNRRRLVCASMAVLVGFIFSFTLVSEGRVEKYWAINDHVKVQKIAKTDQPLGLPTQPGELLYAGSGPDFALLSPKHLEKARSVFSRTIATFSRLAVDRWIGVEGVMAVASYPSKGIPLFMQAAKEKREIGKKNTFLYISKSNLLGADTDKYLFTSLPGPIAFFFYSDSLIIVFLGMFIVSLIAYYSELFVALLLKNPLITAWFSINLMLGFSQAGIDPYRGFLSYFMNIVGIIVLHIIESIYKKVIA